MFKILSKSENELVVYKSTMVDAATCMIKNAEPAVTKQAESALSNMFYEMSQWFREDASSTELTRKKVKFQYLKHKDSDFVEFTSMNSFKIWLIKRQFSEAFMLVLSKLKEYCRKDGNPLPELNIVFGNFLPERIYNTDVYFRNRYRTEWLKSEIIKKAVKDVDKSEVIDKTGDSEELGNANKAAITINSPIFGIMPAEKLSGGIKTLILIYNNPDMIFNASTCGENCTKWIEKFSKKLDFVICLYHTTHFTERKFRAYIVNADTVVESYDDYIELSDKYCRVSE